MVVTDAGGRFRRVNPAFADLVGRTADEMVGVPFSSLTSPDDAGKSMRTMRDLLAGLCKTARIEKRYLRPDGSVVWVDMVIRSVAGPTGEIVGFLTQAVDISARKAAEAEVHQQALLFDAISDAVFIGDPTGNLVNCNGAAERLTGRPKEALLGRRQLPGRRQAGAWPQKNPRRHVARGLGRRHRLPGRAEPTGRRDDDSHGTRLDGEVACRIAVCRDVTEARSNEVALSDAAERADATRLAMTALTGLPNRKYLAERFEDLSRLHAGGGVRASLLMIDLDRFKDVNDTLGHHCGDQLLVEVSRRLRRAVHAGIRRSAWGAMSSPS